MRTKSKELFVYQEVMINQIYTENFCCTIFYLKPDLISQIPGSSAYSATLLIIMA
jgi:hypothetical protein